MGRVDFQVDRSPVDALIVTSNPRCFCLDFPLDFIEIIVPLVTLMQKLSKLRLFRVVLLPGVRFRTFPFIVGDIDELKNERTTSDNA